jgi:hypothetical protein
VSAVSVEVPEGCKLTDWTLRADSDEAFEAAVRELGLNDYGEQHNTRKQGDEHIAYSYRFAASMGVTLRGPKHEMKLVPA